MHTFTYQKTLIYTLLLLVFKIIENLQCILSTQQNINLDALTVNWLFSSTIKFKYV